MRGVNGRYMPTWSEKHDGLASERPTSSESSTLIVCRHAMCCCADLPIAPHRNPAAASATLTLRSVTRCSNE